MAVTLEDNLGQDPVSAGSVLCGVIITIAAVITSIYLLQDDRCRK